MQNFIDGETSQPIHGPRTSALFQQDGKVATLKLLDQVHKQRGSQRIVGDANHHHDRAPPRMTESNSRHTPAIGLSGFSSHGIGRNSPWPPMLCWMASSRPPSVSWLPSSRIKVRHSLGSSRPDRHTSASNCPLAIASTHQAAWRLCELSFKSSGPSLGDPMQYPL